jgi:hypothetical protein
MPFSPGRKESLNYALMPRNSSIGVNNANRSSPRQYVPSPARMRAIPNQSPQEMHALIYPNAFPTMQMLPPH